MLTIEDETYISNLHTRNIVNNNTNYMIIPTNKHIA